MAEEMKHTPTPWDPDVVKIIFEGGLQALIDSGKAGVGETLYACVSGQAELDAFHAAHCVNVHDKLVSALEAAKELYEWVAEKTSRAAYEFDELAMTPNTSPAWQAIEDAGGDGLLASYRDQIDAALSALGEKEDGGGE